MLSDRIESEKRWGVSVDCREIEKVFMCRDIEREREREREKEWVCVCMCRDRVCVCVCVCREIERKYM